VKLEVHGVYQKQSHELNMNLEACDQQLYSMSPIATALAAILGNDANT
jgi:hypothetical protein